MGLDALKTKVDAAGGHRTLADKAFVALHEAIVTGILDPGQRLPIEDLAATFDMSPMPIREAVRRLHSVGLVENVPHRGARVTELSMEDLSEVYEARLALEPTAIRRAAERFTDEDKRVAREALERHVAAYKRPAITEIWLAHTDFHFALYRAAGSRWLLVLIKPLWESSERYRFAAPPEVRRSLGRRKTEHERILEACIRHAPDEAARELHNHLARTANAIAHSMGGGDLFALEDGVPALRPRQDSEVSAKKPTRTAKREAGSRSRS